MNCGVARCLAPLPGRGRRLVSPKPAFVPFCFVLEKKKIVILRVFPVDPGHAAADLLGIRIDSLATDVRYCAAILILYMRDHFSFLAETQVGEHLFGLRAERLSFFWRIDLGQPDFIIPYAQID